MGRPKLPPKPCLIEDCDRVAVPGHRGWCNVHYRRWLRHGDPLTVHVIHGDTEARFWSKVDDNGFCWLWTGSLNDTGYGVIGVGGNRNKLAHRWSYEQFVGPIPEGLHIDHLCRVRNCVNPEHLEPVTNAENARRGADAKTACVNGHAYDEANTVWTLVRICRICRDQHHTEYEKRSRQRLKAAAAVRRSSTRSRT